MGKQLGAASSSPDVCSLPSPSTKCILWIFPRSCLSYKAHLSPRQWAAESWGPGLCTEKSQACSALETVLKIRQSQPDLQTQLQVTFLQGLEGYIWEPCSAMPGSRAGLTHGGRRGCPNRTQSGLSPSWCHSLCVFALIDTYQGCGENFVEGGEFTGGLVLLVSRAGFEPQWKESCKSFYFLTDGGKLEKMSEIQVTMGILIHLGY